MSETDTLPPVGATVTDELSATDELASRHARAWKPIARGERAFQAYYYSLTPTGVTVVDQMLAAIAWAGKAYHHTEGWCDGDVSPVDWIDAAGTDLATAFRALQQERDQLKARVVELEQEMALRQHLYDVHPGPDTEELAAFRALAVEAKAVQGCGDRSCRIAPPIGMGTNGGCRCHDMPHGRRALTIVRRLAALAPKEARDAK